MRKRKPARTPAGRRTWEIPTARPEAESILSRIGDLAGLPSDERIAGMKDIAKAVEGLVVEDAEYVLISAARNWQTAAVPLLEILLEDTNHAITAVEALGYVRSEAVVPLLRNLDQPSRPKAVIKSVRRALHRLRSQGIVVQEVVTPAEIGLAAGRRILKSLLSSVDGRGGQMLSLLLSAPLSGIEAVELVADDLEGIKDVVGAQTTKRKYGEHIEEMREQGLSAVDAPVSYVLFRVREFEAITRERGNPLPSEYQIYRELFHMPGAEHKQPLVYDEIDPETVRSDTSLSRRASELFQCPEFESWFLPEEEIEPFGVQIIEARQSPLVLSDAAKEERVERTMKVASEELLTPEIRDRYKRRLEENAYVLLRTDRAELARVAVACALELGSGGLPSPQILFVQEIIKRSVALFVASEEREPHIIKAHG